SRAALDAADRYEAGELGEDAFRAALHGADEALTRARAEYDPRAADWSRLSRAAGSAVTAANIAREVAARGWYPGVLSDLRRAILDRAGAGGGPRKNPTARTMRPLFLESFGDILHPI